jgi:hypothetical protein
MNIGYMCMNSCMCTSSHKFVILETCFNIKVLKQSLIHHILWIAYTFYFLMFYTKIQDIKWIKNVMLKMLSFKI